MTPTTQPLSPSVTTMKQEKVGFTPELKQQALLAAKANGNQSFAAFVRQAVAEKLRRQEGSPHVSQHQA